MSRYQPLTRKYNILPGGMLLGVPSLCFALRDQSGFVFRVAPRPASHVHRPDRRRHLGPKHLHRGCGVLAFECPALLDYTDQFCGDLCKDFIRAKFEALAKTLHPYYALLMGLPKEHCYIRRNCAAENGCTIMDEAWVEANTFTLEEFFARFEDFDPDDRFGIYLHVHLERIDSDAGAEYVETDCLNRQRYFFDAAVKLFVQHFLESYCERCQRDNRPFELTPATIAQFGFTPDDVETLGPIVDLFNERARDMIRAEYDALAGLDFIREGKRSLRQ